MSMWIKAMTDLGPTRIRVQSICAYQHIIEHDNESEVLLIYTADNTLFEIHENVTGLLEMLDSNFQNEFMN
ncbi:hypothetical protein OAR30_00755 [Euryarchaeota archaeon]|jgi:hypothetical protein|nr:hypothetical protein [Candidatus Thalassarchaeum sp.]MDA7555322.1 hypothetical protein [Euryarchaeota archaeon]MDC0327816.1 hypothetical protein [bacterium]MDC0851473.1 hypothetical protein [Euryarchaeota archaeon]MDC1029107.1 hypothetical protein [Euryarchaeota archaeon]